MSQLPAPEKPAGCSQHLTDASPWHKTLKSRKYTREDFRVRPKAQPSKRKFPWIEKISNSGGLRTYCLKLEQHPDRKGLDFLPPTAFTGIVMLHGIVEDTKTWELIWFSENASQIKQISFGQAILLLDEGGWCVNEEDLSE